MHQRETLFKQSVAAACLYSTRGTMLDIGTGSGRLPLLLSQMAPSITCIGIDINRILLEDANHYLLKGHRNGHISFICADAQSLPFPDQSFDWAVSVASLHQWHNRKNGIMELYRVLKNGGVGLVLVGPEIMWLFDSFRRKPANERDIKAVFHAVGFKDIRISHPRCLLQVIGRKLDT